MIKFEFIFTKRPIAGQLLYRKEEYSFDFLVDESIGKRNLNDPVGVASIGLGTLQLEVEIKKDKRVGILHHVWGYYGHSNWIEKNLIPFSSSPGIIYAHNPNNFDLGCAFDYLEMNHQFNTLYDPDTGWLQIEVDNKILTGDFIEFANGCVALINNKKLGSIFLKPSII